MARSVVVKSEVFHLFNVQSLLCCPYDGKLCWVPQGNCVTEEFGFGLPDKKVWHCPRLYSR